MSADDQPRPPGARTEPRRTREAALILPVIGLALFTPPLIQLFASDLSVVGAPLIVVYIFAVWAALIIAARIMSRRLTAEEAQDSGP